MLNKLNSRLQDSGDPDGFFAGCAVSPFKRTEAECFAQYAKLCRKIAAGAQFVITQLGYDAPKFAELIRMLRQMGMNIPVLGSVYILTPRAARIMNSGTVPGAVVTDALLAKINREWQDRGEGRKLAVERAAKLGAILKGLGYRGMHLEGVHKSFDMVGRILDRLKEIEPCWKEFLPEFNFPLADGFYAFPKHDDTEPSASLFTRLKKPLPFTEKFHFRFLKSIHGRFFSFDVPTALFFRKVCRWIDGHSSTKRAVFGMERFIKKLLLDCLHCGDCGIQHLAFLCPESQCPKHIRNGACGGSRYGMCEVYPDRPCVYARVYRRLAFSGEIQQMQTGCVPPRMWELNNTPSWLNFHLEKDHESVSSELSRLCRDQICRNIAET
jgi:methylenetetrahydrofolate reductase (NADPH)